VTKRDGQPTANSPANSQAGLNKESKVNKEDKKKNQFTSSRRLFCWACTNQRVMDADDVVRCQTTFTQSFAKGIKKSKTSFFYLNSILVYVSHHF
jgi:hypothetical protein